MFMTTNHCSAARQMQTNPRSGYTPLRKRRFWNYFMTNENQTEFNEGKVRMKKANDLLDLIKIGLGIALLTTLVGCVGFVGGGYGGAVIVAPEPNVVVFGGDYDRGHDVHAYSQRGGESRAVAHSGWGGKQ
jgi:hypothetical protein